MKTMCGFAPQIICTIATFSQLVTETPSFICATHKKEQDCAYWCKWYILKITSGENRLHPAVTDVMYVRFCFAYCLNECSSIFCILLLIKSKGWLSCILHIVILIKFVCLFYHTVSDQTKGLFVLNFAYCYWLCQGLVFRYFAYCYWLGKSLFWVLLLLRPNVCLSQFCVHWLTNVFFTIGLMETHTHTKILQ